MISQKYCTCSKEIYSLSEMIMNGPRSDPQQMKFK